MTDREMPATLGGFTAGGAFFGGVDGFLIGEMVGALAGALIGALVGAGLVLLAFIPRPQDSTSVPAHGPHANYMLIWGALFVMTMVEVGVAFLALAKLAIILTLIVLAIWKALLVALYYMHLRYEPRRLWILAASPLPLAIILVTAVLFERW
jgi:cytochrome c oxidase subunit 4